MASFSYKHHPIPLDSIFTAKNISGPSMDHQIHQGINNNTTRFSQFHCPIISEPAHGIIPAYNDDHIFASNVSKNISLSSDENEAKKQSTDSSTVVDKLESSVDDEQVTQKLPIPLEKKRKSRTGSSSNSSQSKEASRGKRQKNGGKKNDVNKEGIKVNKVQEEPPSGYIHVRARRGQATDSHSLAERVRREKISERMKTLQKLVPGCEKVTGKALMLDEIISYVQSLQNQVEFLSMKLASLNPLFYDFIDIDSFLVRSEGLNTLASQVPTVPQNSQSQPTPFTSTLMDNSENGSLLWDMEDQRQSFLSPSGFTNLCSFN